jgi:hypothetical protein
MSDFLEPVYHKVANDNQNGIETTDVTQEGKEVVGSSIDDFDVVTSKNSEASNFKPLNKVVVVTLT